ncbi:hypothetical protein QTP86_013742, partial [Hemibagrus guttatus]
MKCFERLVMRQIKDLLPPSLDPMQFAYRPNRSTDDAISTILHLSLTHLENKDTYIQMLFMDFSSAFNTIIPQHLTKNLSLLGINTSLCNWILDFLTGRPQSVRIGNSSSSTTTLNTGAAQGCVPSSPFPVSPGGKLARAQQPQLQPRTPLGSPMQNGGGSSSTSHRVTFTEGKETQQKGNPTPLDIDGSNVEIIKSTKFLSVHLAEDLTWSLNTSSITKKAQQRLYFLRRLRKAHLPPLILTTFYRGTIESILSSCITAWFGNCTVSDHKTLKRIVRTAEKIIGVSLPSITDIYSTRCIRKANSNVDDPTHSSHTLFTLLPSGK